MCALLDSKYNDFRYETLADTRPDPGIFDENWVSPEASKSQKAIMDRSREVNWCYW